jgi:hypothetical protein
MEDLMIFLVNRLNRAESEPDREEFVRGVANLTPESGKRKVAVGFVAGYLLSKALRKNG